MTIKDVEAKSGLSRVNIRYYESEGLIQPRRTENGYRSFSEADVSVLMKIRLLRSLGLPLESIRAVQQGVIPLSQALREHLGDLSAQQDSLIRSRQLTDQLLRTGADYATLEPSLFLALLDGGGQLLKADAQPRYNLPWRRLFARDLDFILFGLWLTLWKLPLSPLLLGLLRLLSLLLLEPACLHLFGTTPGKAIFGIRITAPDGSPLTYTDALERTWKVLWEGEGLRIPLVSLYFYCKSYLAATEGHPLSWEEDSDLILSDDHRWRYGLLAGAYLILFLLLFWIGG